MRTLGFIALGLRAREVLLLPRSRTEEKFEIECRTGSSDILKHTTFLHSGPRGFTQ